MIPLLHDVIQIVPPDVDGGFTSHFLSELFIFNQFTYTVSKLLNISILA
jgi:hypothetical protein